MWRKYFDRKKIFWLLNDGVLVFMVGYPMLNHQELPSTETMYWLLVYAISLIGALAARIL